MTDKAKRLMVSENIDEVYTEGGLDKLISDLQEMELLYRPLYKRLWVEHDEYELTIWGEREENDKEYNKRTSIIKKAEDRREANERNQYEKLKKKFEKTK